MAHIDKVFQVVVPQTLWIGLQHHSHYPVVAGLPGQRGMYAPIRRAVYWLHMAINVYQTVSDCSTCVRNRLEPKMKSQLNHFLHEARLNFLPSILLVHCSVLRIVAST